MEHAWNRLCRWVGLLGLAAILAACGGGGGGAGSTEPPDARNGEYTMVATNAHVYTLALDFDAESYQLTGEGVDLSGGFSAGADGEFFFEPGNSTGTSGTSTVRFFHEDDTVIGGFGFPEGVEPFIAARDFVTSLADGAGVYNFLGRTVDPAGPENSVIFQGELTAGGKLRLCQDNVIYSIQACPAASVVSGTVTLSGEVFTATFPTGGYPFRIARIGSDKVLLRGSPTTGGARRFDVAVPADADHATGTYEGSATDATWGTATVGADEFNSTVVDSSGRTSTATGTMSEVQGTLRAIQSPELNGMFTIQAGELGVIAAARSNPTIPGLFAIGKRR